MQLAQPHAGIGQALGQAMALAQAGRLDAAEASLRTILTGAPEQPDALQLLGMIARRRGDHFPAIALFRRSLAAQPTQPHVLNNLGNSLSDLGRHADAADAYGQALALDAAYDDARINLALARIALDDPVAAYDELRPLVDARPDQSRAWAVLGQALNAMNRSGEAAAAYRAALDLRPGHTPWMHNLAVALRLTGRAAEALPLLLDCAARSPGEAAIRYNLGHCLRDLGRIDDAADAYRAAIDLAPADAAIHESLSRLLWEHGRPDIHLDSYRAALATRADDPALLAGLANRLTLAGQAPEAAALLAPAVARDIGGAELRCRLGQALWSSGHADEALTAFDAALATDPDHAAALRESARSLLIFDQPHDALPRIARRLAADRHDQQALALQGIAWRLTGDARADWLNDPALIATFVLRPQDGDTDGFNRRLDAALGALHQGQRHPLEQTLRGGTQTADDLFARGLPEIAPVRAMIADAVRHHIAALPQDPAHPFLNRKAGDFAFSGSWSVRLHDGGHHSNHIHPAGWISAVYYVALPDAVGDGEQGWLTFGETGLRLGSRERITRTIRPEPGLLVLFPSYFYHGTIPFADSAHRTTIAFDIVPAR